MNGRRIISITIIAISCFAGCKKGENDPWISFLSRKKRLTGDWTVVDGYGEKQYLVNGIEGFVTEEWDYDGATLTTEVIGSGVDTATAFETAIYFTFGGDHQFSYEYRQENNNGGGNVEKITLEGIWKFTGGGDNKPKSQVLVEIHEEIITNTCDSCLNSVASYTGTDAPTMVWDLDKLKNKELTLKWNGTADINGDAASDKGRYELIKN